MSASPADIAAFTNDGVLLTARDTAIRDAHATAIDQGSDEIITFFDNAAAGQAMLAERFALLSAAERMHEGIVVDDSLGLGSTLSITPALPRFRIIDEERGIDGTAFLRAYSFDHNNDRYALEMVGTS